MDDSDLTREQLIAKIGKGRPAGLSRGPFPAVLGGFTPRREAKPRIGVWVLDFVSGNSVQVVAEEAPHIPDEETTWASGALAGSR